MSTKDQLYSVRSLNLRTASSLKSRTRDISHLTDSQCSSRMKEQILSKQRLGEIQLTDYITKQRQRKSNEAYFQSNIRVKTEEELPTREQPLIDAQLPILGLLEQFAEINFDALLEELQCTKERKDIFQTIQNDIRKNINEPKSLNSLFSLKQQSSHFFSQEPTGRSDVISLQKWLQKYLEGIIKYKDKNNNQILSNVTDVLYICFQELIRQVSYSCAERGQLLFILFKGFLMMCKKQLSQKENEKLSLKRNYFEKHLLYQKEKDILEEAFNLQSEAFKQEIEELKAKDSTVNQERNSYQQTILKLQRKLEISQSLQKKAVSQITNLQRELSYLEYKLAKKQQQQQSIQSVKTIKQNQTQNDDVEEQDLSLSQVLKEVNLQAKIEGNADMIVKDIIEELPKVTHSIGVQTFSKVVCVVETQTDLQLISSQYDKFLSVQEIENTYKEFELKQQLEQQDWLDGLYEQMNLHQDEPSIQEIDRINKIELIQEVPEDECSPDIKRKKFSQNDYTITNKTVIERSETSEKLIAEIDQHQQYGSDKLLKVKQIHYNKEQNSHLITSQQSSQRQIKVSPQAQPNSCRSGKSDNGKIKPQQNQINQQQKFFSAVDLDKKNEKQKQNNKKLSVQTQNFPSTLQIQHSNDSFEKSELLQPNLPILSKQQSTMLMVLYQIQKQKSINANLKIQEINELLIQILQFARKLTVHILKTQYKTHTQIAEEFLFEFETLRKKTSNDKEILEEEYIFDEQKEKEEKKKEAIKRRNGRIQKAIRLNFLTKSMRPAAAIDRLLHPGVILAVKAREQSHLFKKVVAYWPVKNVLRTITQIYSEKTQISGETDMQIFVFNFLLNKYGFKHVAEKKYMQFLLSLIHFNQIFRINIFSRLMCLMHEDNLNYTQEEVQFFLSGLEYIFQSTLGVNIVQGESESKYNVPYLRALDYIKVQLENKLTEDEIKEIRNDLENMKEPDPKNKAGIIDLDMFMVKVLEKYRIVTHRTKLFVIHAFQAADLDGNKKINHNEFLTLYRHIETEKFNFQEALDLFDDQADIVHQGEKNLSFNRFTSVCVNQQIFTEQSLNDFIGGEANLDDNFALIIKSWPTYKTEIQGLLTQLQPFVTAEIYQDWVNILYTLEKRISVQKIDHNSMRPILIAYKILKLELTRLLSDEDEQNQNKE